MGYKNAEFVRWVGPEYVHTDLVNEAKALTWDFEAEHMLILIKGDRLALIRGGRDGIDFRGKAEPGGPIEGLLMEIGGVESK